MLSHVKNRFSIESVHFVHFVSKNVVSVSGVSAVNLIIERFREIFYFVSVDGFCVTSSDNFFFYFGQKRIEEFVEAIEKQSIFVLYLYCICVNI